MTDENQDKTTPSSGEDGQQDQNQNQLDDDKGEGQVDLAERSKGRGYQERIDELTGKIYTLEKELKDTQKKVTVPPPPPDNTPPDVQQKRKAATDYIHRELGFPTTTDVEQKLQAIEDRMALNNEHMRLQGEYDGEDGRPKYNKTKIEDFMRDHAVYDPEVAYKALHEAELLDWAMKKGQGERKARPYVEKGGSSSRNAIEDKTITRDKIEEWMKTPEGRMKYEQNRSRILEMMTKGEL